MPKTKEIGLDVIPKIYKRNSEEVALLFWVLAQRSLLPSMSIKESIYRFFEYTNITTWDIDCALVVFNNLQNDFLNDFKADRLPVAKKQKDVT